MVATTTEQVHSACLRSNPVGGLINLEANSACWYHRQYVLVQRQG